MTAPRGRAEPMTPDDRRRAIAEAVIPLLAEHGASVTTRQIAEAAGVAEGTIFRAFPDKCAVIHHALRVIMDPEADVAAIEAIDGDASLEAQLGSAIEVLTRRQERILAVLGILRALPHHGEDEPSRRGAPPFLTEANAAITAALTGLFDRHRRELLVEPARAAVMLRGLLLASGHLRMTAETELGADEISGLLRHGILRSGPH